MRAQLPQLRKTIMEKLFIVARSTGSRFPPLGTINGEQNSSSCFSPPHTDVIFMAKEEPCPVGV